MGGAAPPPRDGRLAASPAHQHRPPDPFEDIPAPRLRPLRPGPTPLLAKPRTAPLPMVAVAPPTHSRGPEPAVAAAAVEHAALPVVAPLPAAAAAGAGSLRSVGPTMRVRPTPRPPAGEVAPSGGNAAAVERRARPASAPDSAVVPALCAGAAHDDEAGSAAGLDGEPASTAGREADRAVIAAAAAQTVRDSAAEPDAAAAPASARAEPAGPGPVSAAPEGRDATLAAQASPNGPASVEMAPPAAGTLPGGAAGPGRSTAPLGSDAAPRRPIVKGGAPRRRSGVADLRRAILAGLLLAVGIVGLALFLRPAPGETTLAPEATEVRRYIGSGPAQAEGGAAAPASTPAADALVRLRLDPDLTAARRDALGAAARAAGYRAVKVLPMPVPIERSRIEYFAPADRAAAEALARALAPVTGGLVEMRDLGGVGGATEPGRIDAWLASDRGDR